MTEPSAGLVVPARRALVARVAEWIFRPAALGAARQQEATSPVAICRQRARIAAEVGARALEPPAPWRNGDACHLAAALFAESLAWSLAASVGDAAAPPTASHSELRPPTARELEQLLGQAAELLAAAAGGVEQAARVRAHLLERRFELAHTPPAELRAVASELSHVATALLKQQHGLHSAVHRIELQRVLRVFAVSLVIACLAAATNWLVFASLRRTDISAGKPWRQSSVYQVACTSPARHCANSPDYFFHTFDQSNPWLELDLQREQQLAGVEVINRRDCCRERAVPLVVEVSTDQLTWHEVIRRDEVFSTWHTSFKPTHARWLRVRIAGRAYLHLSDVKVFG